MELMSSSGRVSIRVVVAKLMQQILTVTVKLLNAPDYGTHRFTRGLIFLEMTSPWRHILHVNDCHYYGEFFFFSNSNVQPNSTGLFAKVDIKEGTGFPIAGPIFEAPTTLKALASFTRYEWVGHIVICDDVIVPTAYGTKFCYFCFNP